MNSESSKQPLLKHFLNSLFIGNTDRLIVYQNLGLLVRSGVPIDTALRSISDEVNSHSMRHGLNKISRDVEEGVPLSLAMAKTGIIPSHVISLIRVGEESGRLEKNLELIALQEEKQHNFQEKIRSALLYPAVIFGATLTIGLAISWFILPRLSQTFSGMRIELPLITKIVIRIGEMISTAGVRGLISILALFALTIFLIRIVTPLRTLTEWIVLRLPGIGAVLRQTEVARFGFVLGTLLQAGFPIVSSIQALEGITAFSSYRKLYQRLAEAIDSGQSFKVFFNQKRSLRQLIPPPVQQIIIAGENSGQLASVLESIGTTTERRLESSTRNVATLLEPLLLVIVWLGVALIAIAVILPIYSLIGSIQ